MLLVQIFAFSQTEHKPFYDNGNLKQVGQFDENGKCTGEWKNVLNLIIYTPIYTQHNKQVSFPSLS